MKLKNLYRLASALCLAAAAQAFVACSDSDSELVAFGDDNTLSSPNDTVYSLIGIINKLQVVADRTILLGELRGDLTALTPDATTDLQQLAGFSVADGNPYNDARDYYAIIQNCNYYLATADTSLTIRGRKVFEKEYAVVKTYRAWTYLQLALNYGSVPFYTQPIMTEKEADPGLYPRYDVRQVADYFISDLAPWLDTELPAYGDIESLPSQKFYIPTRLLVADLCLWSGRYAEAARHYHDWLTRQGSTQPTGLNASSEWRNADFIDTEVVGGSFASQFGSTTSPELIAYIPMMSQPYDGVVSYLTDVFNSTADNNYYYQATHSRALDELSAAQTWTAVRSNPVNPALRDTLSPPADKVYTNELLRGDLRLYDTYALTSAASAASSAYATVRQTCRKYSERRIVRLYRLQHVYLRYAEALNRAGHPEAAFLVLKRGLCDDNLTGVGVSYISPEARAAAGELISFSPNDFTANNTQGIHARGCYRADADKGYAIPDLPTQADSILWVENAICDEMALETAAEGLRFYDLMRLSLHRGDPTFLAGHVARRNGAAQFDAALYARLSDPRNWYLPLDKE